MPACSTCGCDPENDYLRPGQRFATTYKNSPRLEHTLGTRVDQSITWTEYERRLRVMDLVTLERL